MTDNSEKALLVLVASGRREYREDALAAVSRRFRVHLVDAAEPTWQRQYVESHDVLTDFGAAAVTELARRLRERGPIVGVVCWDEARILPATRLATELGLPSAGLAAVEACRDKYAARRLVAERGVAQPRFAVVSDVDSAVRVADEIGYPVVLKPRSAAASLGVVLVRDREDLVRHFAFADGASISGAPQHDAAVLVEQYVTGAEISVDSLVEDGEAVPLVVARKSVGYAPFFEETGHRVATDDPLLADEAFIGVIKEIHRAIGFQWGWTHVELKLTEDGPVLIEVNARVGGGLIPRLAYLAHGIEPADLLADAVRGVRGRARAPRPGRPSVVAANRFLYATRDGVEVESVTFDQARLPPEVDRAVILTEPGARLHLPPEGLFSGRAAVVIVVASDADAADKALDRAAEAFELRVSG